MGLNSLLYYTDRGTLIKSSFLYHFSIKSGKEMVSNVLFILICFDGAMRLNEIL